MKTSTFRRFMPLIALMLCATTLIVHAQSAPASAGADAAATPPSATATPANAAADAQDWDVGDDHDNRHGRHSRHGHHGDDLVSIGHDSYLQRGQHADSVVSIAGSSTSDGEAREVVSILGNTRTTGEVSDTAVAVLGSTYVNGKVGGDVVAVLGNVELGPNSEIDGDVVAVGGNVVRDPAAIIHGDVHDVLTGNFGSLGGLSIWIQHCLLYGRPLALVPGLGWAWGLALACLALYVCIALLFRTGLTQCVRTFETQPGHTALAALIAMLLTPVLVVLLCVTVIGIAAVPFVMLGLFCAGLFGKAVMLALIGKRVVGDHTTGTLSHPAFAVLVGGLLVLVLYVVPFLGFVVYKLLGFLGLGAVVYTLILTARARQATKQAAIDMAGPSGTPARPSPSGAPSTPAPMAAAAAPESAAAAAAAPDSASASAAAPPSTTAPASAAPSPSTAAFSSTAAPAAAAAPIPGPVTATLPRAGFWIRMAALLIDVLLIGIVTSVLHQTSHLHLLVLAAYGAVMWKMRGSTIGGIVFDLRVVRLDGREIDWETAIIRALSCFLSLAVAGLGFFWIAFDGAHQAWHDKIAGTVVVRVAKGVPLV
jgi:uncharacterized RDD family membrane protein YckC